MAVALYYTLVLIGAMIGIGAGIFCAFDTAVKREERALSKKENSNEEKPASSKREQRRLNRQEKRRKKIELKTGKETETHRSLRERVEARNLSSYTDVACDFAHKDSSAEIEANREGSNESYRYLKRK